MKPSLLWTIPFFWALAPSLSAQTVVLTNPSSCDSLSPQRRIADFSCPDNSGFFNPNRFVIQVVNVAGTALGRDVFLREVRLQIRHPWAADLDIRLISPSGRSILLSADNGGGDNDYGDPTRPNCQGYMTFSDASCASITTANAPFTDQAYRPQESLLSFNDQQTSPNGDWILQICDDTEQDFGRLDYVELVFAPLDCRPVEGFALVNQDTTGATFNWSAGQDCATGNTYLEYGPVGFVPGTGSNPGQGVVRTAGCPPFQLTNLQPDTEYEFYLRRSCGANGFSENSCPLRLRTGCLPPQPRTLETFDAQGLCDPICNAPCALTGFWRNDSTATFRWLAYSAPTPTQATGPEADVSGNGRYVYIETTGVQCAVGSRATLLSGCFQLDKKNTDACHLSFYYHMFGPTTGTLRLEATADGGLTWTSLWERRGDQGNRWIKEYISLAAFPQGAILQFRFVGTKGNGSAGDIGLDQIALHGSTYLGFAGTRYYADADGDGFGNPNQVVRSCAPNPPNGYVINGTDCNDQDAAIHPAAPEIPCDNIDNNCNGFADDAILPAPLGVGDTICSGQTPQLRATPVAGDAVVWYTTATGGVGVFSTNPYRPSIPPNTGATPLTYTFFAEAVDSRRGCVSSERTPVSVLVLPAPRPEVPTGVAVCLGSSIDLASLNLTDLHFTSASLTFHQALPATPANRLDQTIIQPTATTSYFFLMTSRDGCTAAGTGQIQVRPPAQLQPVPARSLGVCLEAQQAIGMLATGGSGTLSYRWSTGATTSSINITGASTPGFRTAYRVTVTDAAGCRSIDSIVVNTTSNIDSVRRAITNVSACNGRDGQIRLEPLTGQAPFRYRWTSTNGTSGDTLVATGRILELKNLAQAAYAFTITDNTPQGCQFVLRNAYVNGPGAEVRAVQIDPVRCRGAANGAIRLDVRGNPRYRWSTGDTTATIQGLSGGTYQVTITGGICQTIIDGLVVPEADSLKLATVLQPPTCHDALNGSISTQVFGGTRPYRWRWSTGSALDRLDRLAKGNYNLTITDEAGCELTRLISLPGPDPLQVRVDSLRSLSCKGANDGLIHLSAQGGTGPYRVQWSNGSDNPRQNQLAPGNYAVTITDDQGCRASRSLSIGEPPALTLSRGEVRAPQCFGDTTGRIILTAAGGTAPYRFNWSGGQMGSTLANLGVGTYTAVVVDANNCQSDSLPTTLTAISRIDFQADLTPPTCNGLTDGAISIQGANVAAWRFNWSTGATSNRIAGLATGRYQLKLEDEKGCTIDTIFSLQPARDPLAAVVTAIPPSCAGNLDGLINVQMTRVDHPPVTYRWGDGSNLQNRTQLLPGRYALTITDQLGCQKTYDSIALQANEPLAYTLVGRGEVLCQGDSTGFIELAVTGGVKPYTYNWVGVAGNRNAVYGLKAGEYRVFIQDANGCPINASFQLSAPPALRPAIEVRVGNICAGDSSNLLIANATGGVAPYSFQWNFGPNQPIQANLQPGDYWVKVRDANGCTVTSPSVKLRDEGSFLKLLSFSTRDISCFGRKDGEVSVSIQGGFGPFRYQFTNFSEVITTDQTTVSIKGLPADSDYQVVVLDARGCRIQSSQRSIREPLPLNLRRDSLRNVNCAGEFTGGIFTSVSGGTPPYAFNWYEAGTNRLLAITEDLQFARSGSFYGVVTDGRLCEDTLGPLTISSSPPIRLKSVNVTNILCKGTATGRIAVELEGGREPFRYEWNNRSGGKVLSNVTAGNYQLVVIDAGGCRAAFSPIAVSEPATALLVRDTVSAVRCFGRQDGQIRIGVTGGTPPYRWDWQDARGTVFGIDARQVSNLLPGTYTLSMNDAANCNRIFQYTVTQPDLLKINFELVRPSQASLADGTIKALVSGGTPTYNYRWNTTATTPTLTGIARGKYVLTVTDARNCQARDSIQVTSVGIWNHQALPSVQLFPNPASTVVELHLERSELIPLRLEIRSATGQLWWQETLPEQYRLSHRLLIGHWPPGTYTVLLRGRGRVLFSTPLLITR